MAQFFTNFDEYPVGDITTSGQTDWTPKITNGSADYRIIDGGDADNKFLRVQAISTNGTRVLGYNPLNGVSDNLETLVKFWIFKSGADGSTGRYGAAYTRYGGNSEASTIGYAVGFIPITSVKSLALFEDSTGVVQYQNYAWAMSTDYFVRTRISGTLRQVKIWPASSAEPGTWTFQSNGALPTIASPYSGVGTYQGDSYLYVKQFSAGTDGDTAPMAGTKTLAQIGNASIVAAPSTELVKGMGGGWGTFNLGTQYAGLVSNGGSTTVTLDQSGNARIERVESTTISGNSRIELINNATQQGNSRIEAVLSIGQTGNARIERIENITQSGDSRIERIVSLDQTGNATVESFYFAATIDQTGNARIERTDSLQQQGNGRIERIENATQIGNAFIEWQKTLDQTGNAAIILQRTVDQTGNAFIQLANSISQIGNAFIEWQLQLQQSGDARIEKVFTITQTGAAVLIRIDSLDQIGNARIQRTESISIVGNARIRNPSPDKRPQDWEDASTEAPAAWLADDRQENEWEDSGDKPASNWQNSDDRQNQQWSDSDNKPATEWQREYYD